MTRPLVLITEPIAPEPLRWLTQHVDTRVLDTPNPDAQLLARAEGLVVRTYTRVDHRMLQRAPRLRVVARAGVGLDNIDLQACAQQGVVVVHTPEANAQAVVEYVISLMLEALRPIERVREPLDQSSWDALRARAVTPRSCVGAQMGIIGFGRVGSGVARAAAALGMRVRYCDLREIPEAQRCGATPCSMEEIARRCEVISVHVDGRASNRHLIGERFLRDLGPETILINASRGFVLDTEAACAFARANPGARLILDVHDPEPIPRDSPLWSLPNATLTPHIAAGTRQAKEAMSWVVRDLVRVLEGKPAHHRAR